MKLVEYFADSLVGTSGINGDMFYVSPDKSTLLLSDGASGAGNDGKALMSHCCVRVAEALPFADSGLSPKEYLEKVIWKINNELIMLSQEKKKYVFGTLAICVVDDNKATFATVGDSPTFLINSEGIRRVAKPKKTYDNLIQMGLFSEEQLEAYVHQLPEYMWSMFDRFLPMVVPAFALEEYEVTNGDMIVLCCDGVSDYLSPEELERQICPEDLQESVRKIIEMAKEAAIKEHGCNRYDDITVVVYRR